MLPLCMVCSWFRSSELFDQMGMNRRFRNLVDLYVWVSWCAHTQNEGSSLTSS
jgi:hypothetical protein